MDDNWKGEKYLGYGAAALIGLGCLAVLRPFLSALLWGAIICYTTWPVFQFVKKQTKGRNTLSACIMTIMITAVLLMPFAFVAFELAENISRFSELKNIVRDDVLPSFPKWLAKIPVAGSFLSDKWKEFSADTGLLLLYVKNFVVSNHSWFFNRFFDIGGALFELTLSVFACFFFYRDGEFFAHILEEAVNRIAGTFKHHVIETVGNTIRGVVYGIIGTAIWQGAAAGFGFWIAGVPSALLLGFVTFVLSPIPAGPPIVWIGASIWLFNHGFTGWGIFLLIWGAIAVSSADNVIRTYLISKSANISFILILLGVLGGVLYFGFIGIFLGPVLLAIGYNILKEFCIRDQKALSAEEGKSPQQQ